MAILKRENLSDKLADIYGQKIIHNELKSGDTIRETQIAKEWEVSRSPVRDALHLLEKAKLVVKDKRGSYRVLELTADYIESFYDAFNMLYQYSFAKAAENMTPKNYKIILSMAKKMEKAAEKDDFKGYVESATVFGKTILESADNPIINGIALELMPTAHRIMYAAISIDPSHVKKACVFMRSGCEHIKSKEPEKAAEDFKHFSAASRNSLIKHIQTTGDIV